MWRKGNPRTLLLGIYISASTVENNIEVSKKIKIELPYDLVIPLLGIYLKTKQKH